MFLFIYIAGPQLPLKSPPLVRSLLGLLITSHELSSINHVGSNAIRTHRRISCNCDLHNNIMISELRRLLGNFDFTYSSISGRSSLMVVRAAAAATAWDAWDAYMKRREPVPQPNVSEKKAFRCAGMIPLAGWREGQYGGNETKQLGGRDWSDSWVSVSGGWAPKQTKPQSQQVHYMHVLTTPYHCYS